VSSFMDGVDPDFHKFIDTQLQIIYSTIADHSSIQQDKIDEMKNQFNNAISEFKRQYFINPILQIVSSLPKSDLAEMAEALVNLTSFKRHVSTNAETVGGPTDVAIISKADGFIWVNRKHYFEPKFNQHFFENYYRENNEKESI
jgi:hypothetical protein